MGESVTLLMINYMKIRCISISRSSLNYADVTLELVVNKLQLVLCF